MWKVLPAALVLVAAQRKPTVVIVDLDSPTTMNALAGQVTEALARTAKEQGMGVVTPDEVRARLAPKELEELRKCGARPSCVQARLGSAIKADRAVIGSLTRDEKNYLLKLQLIDLESMQTISEVDQPILIASRRFTHDVNAVVPGLLRGERAPRGKLELTTNVKSATVTVDGEPSGPTPLSLELKPGKHEVKVEKNRYLPVTRLVTIEVNQTTREEVRLILKPGERPEEEDLPSLASAKKGPAEGAGLRLPVGAWAAGGVAVAAGAGAIVFGSMASSGERRLLEGYDPQNDTWAGTRREALEVKRNALYANVAWTTAGVALVTGVVLTLTASDGAATEVTPVAGPGGGGVVLSGRF
jgi:hypothetical protein